MLKFPTVFVVGAGASAAFDFPVSSVLLNEAKAHSPEQIREITNGPLSLHQASIFSRVLNDSQEESLDAMLETQPPAFQAAGKRLIAARLLRCEDSSIGRGKFFARDWFQYLFSRMTEGVTSSSDFWKLNDVWFVTYNYDRLIEFKLMSGLRAKYGAGEEQHADVERRVIHLHGSLGRPFPSEGHVPFGARGGDPALDPLVSIREFISTSEHSIRIVHEPKPTDEAFNQARRVLGGAERVFFLGFGFGKTNVDRLDLSCINRSAQLFYTRMGMTEAETSLYVLQPFGHYNLGQYGAYSPDWDALRLIRETVSQIFVRY